MPDHSDTPPEHADTEPLDSLFSEEELAQTSPVQPGTAPAIISTRSYRRIFSYYGSKSKIAHLYPTPQHDVVIEPFAGSAAYSALHYERQVCINEKDEITASVWQFLLRADAMEYLAEWFPKHVQQGVSITSLFPFGVDRGFINLMRTEVCQGGFGATGYNTILTPWGSKSWNQLRGRLEYWIPRIAHWTLTSQDYSQIPNRTATWFIDPPYNNEAGSIYRTRGLDYNHLARWSLERDGQVMVCENEGATWMPFRYLTKRAGAWSGRDERTKASGGEVIWEKHIDSHDLPRPEPSALDFLNSVITLTPDISSKNDDLSVLELSSTAPRTSPTVLPVQPSTLVDAPSALDFVLFGPTTAEPAPKPSVLVDFLNSSPTQRQITWTAAAPLPLDGIDDIALNVETNGLNWRNGHRPIGITVGSLDGMMKQFLPFGFAAGNLDEATVKEWVRRELRGKHILNANTRFDVHMLRAWGIDLEEQGCTVSDVMHYAALLDDHRKQFKLDVLVKDFLHEDGPPRVDETRMSSYEAHEVAERALYQVEAVARLRDEMWPELDAQDLQRVRQLEDDVIYPLCEMERNGAPIDVPLLEQMTRECEAEHNRLLLEISDDVGFVFDHTAKGWQRLFEKLGLPQTENNTEETIAAIDHPTVKKAHLAAQYASLKSKSFNPYLKQITNGVLYYDINQLRGDDGGTVSGRFSIGYVQQVPNHDNHHATFGIDEVDDCEMLSCRLFPRRLHVAGSGVYLDSDAMQIEQRLFAHFANNKNVLEEYRKDPRRSFHKITWEMLKQARPAQLYVETKSFNFARQYGAKMIKLAVMMKFIPAKEGDEIKRTKRWDDPRLTQIKEIERAYTKMLPEGDALLDYASHLAKPACDDYCKRGDTLHKKYEHRGYVKTILGRRSRFHDNYKTYIGLNRVLQGSGADLMKMKIVELHHERKHTGLLMRLTVHDAVGGDALETDTLTKVSEILNRQSFDLRVPILWDVHTGASWAACK